MNAGTRALSATERMLHVIERHTGSNGGVLPLADLSVTFGTPSPAETRRRFNDPPRETPYLYGRMLQPSVALLGEMVAALEGSEAGYGVASGLAAIGVVINALSKPGDHAVVSDSLYGGSVALLRSLVRDGRLRITPVDINDFDAVRVALKKKRTRFLLVESTSNPLMIVADIQRLGDEAKRAGVPLVVDNTFMPFCVQPIALGADIVVHSLTKFAGGYSDYTAGGIACTRAFWEKILHATLGAQTLHGAVLDARAAHELVIRMQDMHVRFSVASANARSIADLAKNAGISVRYPTDSASCAILTQMGYVAYGFGGVLGLDLLSQESAEKFHAALVSSGFATPAVSLGSVHTYAVCLGSPAGAVSPDGFQINPPGLIRVAVGRSPEHSVMVDRFASVLRSTVWK